MLDIIDGAERGTRKLDITAGGCQGARPARVASQRCGGEGSRTDGGDRAGVGGVWTVPSLPIAGAVRRHIRSECRRDHIINLDSRPPANLAPSGAQRRAGLWGPARPPGTPVRQCLRGHSCDRECVFLPRSHASHAVLGAPAIRLLYVPAGMLDPLGRTEARAPTPRGRGAGPARNHRRAPARAGLHAVRDGLFVRSSEVSENVNHGHSFCFCG